MTDPTLPADDEIVSAVLDGEATVDERARFDADPTADERLARFAAVARRVAAPVPVDPQQRERAIARALDASDLVPGASAPDHTPRPPDALAAQRARRSARIGPLLAAAAAVVVVMIGLGALLRSTGPTDQLATGSVAADSSTEPTAATSGGADADGNLTRPQEASPPAAADESAPTTTVVPATDAAGAPVDAAAPQAITFGEVGSPGQLRTLVLDVVGDRDPLPTTAPPTAPGAPDPSRSTAGFGDACEATVRRTDPEVGPTVVAGTATFEGRDAVVYAFAIDRAAHPAANGSLRIYALGAQDCAPLSVQTIR